MKDLAFQELELNLKYSSISLNEFLSVGYQFDPGEFLFALIIPKGILK